MISRRTILIAILVIFVIDMIQAGVIDDIKDVIHYDDIKDYTKNAAHKTGEAASKAFTSVKKFFTQDESTISEVPTTLKPSS